VGNKVRSGTTKDIEVDTNLLEKEDIRLGQWIDDRNGVRIQEKVRLSLYPQVERSGYVYNVVSRIRRPGGEVPYF
jgi:hypothetical protein